MKRINIVLMILTIVLALINVLNNLSTLDLVTFAKDISIVFTVTAPYIFQKLFKIKLSEGFTAVWVIFIFMAHYLGASMFCYSIIPYFDKVTHTISGILTAYIAMTILDYKKVKGVVFNILFIVAFSWMCAGLWETFEFVCDNLFHGDAQLVAETGVTDTMGDMLVAFAGSIVFSIWYVFQTKRLSSRRKTVK